MAKAHYHFDAETLSYRKIPKGFKFILRKIAVYFFSSLIIGIGIASLLFTFVESPKLKNQRRENARLQSQITLMNQELSQASEILEEIQNRDDNIYRVIFEADPIPSSIRKAGFGGTNRYGYLQGMQNSDIVINTKKSLDILKKQLYIQTKSFDEIVELARNKEKMLQSIPAIMPVSNRDLTRTASGWGYRIHPIEKIRKFHYGMDFTAPLGTDIYASGNGKVVTVVRNLRSGYGNYVVIDHGYGYETLYGHMSGFNVKKNQRVNRGDIIGFVGNTGRSTGPHLHYEVRYKNKPINPKDFYYMDLTPSQYEEMINIASNQGQTFD